VPLDAFGLSWFEGFVFSVRLCCARLKRFVANLTHGRTNQQPNSSAIQQAKAHALPTFRNTAKYGCWLPSSARRGGRGAGGSEWGKSRKNQIFTKQAKQAQKPKLKMEPKPS
jgi:hypothetical protein